MIYLRAADLLDSRSLAVLRAASLVELGLLPHGDAHAFTARATNDFCSLFRAGRIAAWVACDRQRLVASSCAVFYDRLPYPDGSRHAELCGVYVSPAYRRQGFASELVQEVVAAARAGGARKTYLRPSKAGKSLYARIGFIDTELMTFDAERRPGLRASQAGKLRDMSTEITHDDVTPPAAPDHQCINASCGCNDLVSAGACSEWCNANTTELSDLQRGKDSVSPCSCGHETCRANRGAAAAGTPERGMS